MTRILKFVCPGSSLGQETLKILGAAYDSAIASLHSGMLSESVYAVVATRLIDTGMSGERDSDTLQKLALRGL
jgi:hypothetical protein